MSRAVEAYLRGIDAAAAPHVVVDEVDELDELEALGDVAASEVDEPQQQMTSFENRDGGRTVDGGGPPLPAPLAPMTPTDMPRLPMARVVPSLIEGVSDQAWTEFVMAMRTAQPGAVSASNALGMFELKPRRLADLGLVRNVALTRSPTNRMAWVGEFVAPLTQKKFLGSPEVQYRAFAESMRRYVDGLTDGTVPSESRPEDMTLSGALAILHRCGPNGLKSWANEDKRFPDTIALYDKVNGIF